MFLGIITAIFFALALLGVPLVWALLGTAVLSNMTLDFPYPAQALMVNFIGGVEPFHLVAVPLFILSGEIISRGGVGERLIAFARTLFGFLPGGLGIVTVVGCMMFGAVSGSAIATAAAIGTVMAPGMAAAGYRPAFTGALIATAGTLGIIIPPSIPMLVFGFVANTSVAELFIAGIVPGILFGVALMVVCVQEGRRTGCDPGGRMASGAEIMAAFRACAPALLMPLIILGGIYSGVFTPTEAAGVATVYALFVSMVVYRSLPLSVLPEILRASMVTSAVVMLVIGATSALAWLITLEQVPAQMLALVREVAHERWAFLLLLNLVLLVLGVFLEPLPAMVLAAPLFLPAAQAYGIDNVHLGIIFTSNLAIGLYSPPVGGTLFVAAKIAGVGMAAISRALIPLFLSSLVVMTLITYVEAVPMALVWLGR